MHPDQNMISWKTVSRTYQKYKNPNLHGPFYCEINVNWFKELIDYMFKEESPLYLKNLLNVMEVFYFMRKPKMLGSGTI